MRVLYAVSVLLTLAGAALTLAGTFAPWAIVKVLHVTAGVPGVLFAGGSICLAVAVLVLVGARRWPLLCIVGAIVVLAQAHAARTEVPRRVKSQIVGAQMGLFPVNRLLDQFHIGDIQAGDWTTPDADLLGPGLTWTTWGGTLLLIGGLFGLPSDPAARYVYGHTARTRCPGCGKRWAKARQACFCAACGTPLVPADRRPCGHCSRMPERGDVFCAGCGQEL